MEIFNVDQNISCGVSYTNPVLEIPKKMKQ